MHTLLSRCDFIHPWRRDKIGNTHDEDGRRKESNEIHNDFVSRDVDNQTFCIEE
jgi:hypothetical protein